MRAVLGLTIAATTLGSVLSAQPPAPPAPGNLVHVDAVVSDAVGIAVRTLKPDDFTIVEDGVSEKVESATFVAADGRGSAGVDLVPVASREDEQAEARRPGTRVFAIFLDEYHVAKGEEADRARRLATEFIERNLGPRDLAVVVKPLDSILNFRLTHDRRELLAAVSTFEGRKGDYTAKNAFEQSYVASAPAWNEAARSQIVTSLLNALASHIGSLQPGRKTIVVVSDGFSRPPRRRDEALPTVEQVARTANRVGVSIYAVDPRALGEPAPAADHVPVLDVGTEHEALRVLATETDGRTAFTPADVAGAIPPIAADVSGYYILTFHPAHPGEWRTFHPIDVRVKRAALVVHARKGYWPVSLDDLVQATETRRAALPVPPPQPMRHASAMIHPWFGVARASDAGNTPSGGAMQVSFVWDAVPPVPGDRGRRGSPALVSVRATRNADGVLVFSGAVRPSNAPRDDVPSEVVFQSPPGRLLLQLDIQDADGNVLDTDVRDVIVGGLAGPVEVGTPEVLRAESARAFRALLADPDAVPVPDRDFGRADHLVFRLPVYTRGEPITVSATVSSKPGNTTRPLTIEPLEGTAMYQADLSLAGLVVGSYAVTITASGPVGSASETVDFRLVP